MSASPNFTAHVGLYRQLARHSVALLGLPFSVAAPTDSTTRPNSLPDIPFYHFLAYLAPSSGLRCRLAHLETRLLVYHFYHFAYFIDHAGLYRQLFRRPMTILALPFPGCRACQIYTVNKRTYRIRRRTIFAFVSAPCRFTTPLSPSVREPAGLPFLPILAPGRVYIAN